MPEIIRNKEHIIYSSRSGRVIVIPPPNENGEYDIGADITIIAEPNKGYRFKEWGGMVTYAQKKDNPLKTKILREDVAIKAYFRVCTPLERKYDQFREQKIVIGKKDSEVERIDNFPVTFVSIFDEMCKSNENIPPLQMEYVDEWLRRAERSFDDGTVEKKSIFKKKDEWLTWLEQHKEGMKARLLKAYLGLAREYDLGRLMSEYFTQEKHFKIVRSVVRDKRGSDFTILHNKVIYHIHAYTLKPNEKDSVYRLIKEKRGSYSLEGYHIDLPKKVTYEALRANKLTLYDYKDILKVGQTILGIEEGSNDLPLFVCQTDSSGKIIRRYNADLKKWET